MFWDWGFLRLLTTEALRSSVFFIIVIIEQKLVFGFVKYFWRVYTKKPYTLRKKTLTAKMNRLQTLPLFNFFCIFCRDELWVLVVALKEFGPPYLSHLADLAPIQDLPPPLFSPSWDILTNPSPLMDLRLKTTTTIWNQHRQRYIFNNA